MPVSLDLPLACSRPDAYPEQRVKVSGFKPEIDAVPWLTTEVSHRLDSNSGFTTDLRMEKVS